MTELAANSTKERILDAAAELFSEKGFAETSMRHISRLAKVNLASINYYFGSKDELINAVFLRTVEPLISALNNNLDELKKQQAKSLESLEHSLRVLVEAGLKRSQELKGGGGIFIRLLSLAYSDPEAKVRNHIVKQYALTLTGYINAFLPILKHVPKEELFWRIYFMLGALMFIMSSETTLSNIAKRDYQFNTSYEKLVDYLVNFFIAGFKA